MKYLVHLLVLVSIMACKPSSPLELEKPVFFDIHGLMKSQASTLSNAKAGVVKQGTLDTVLSAQNIQFYDSLWKYELEIFREMDLNSPALKGLYQTIEMQTDSGKWVLYTTESTAESRVEELKIFFAATNEVPNLIHAKVKYQNTLFTSFRTLDLHFEDSSEFGHLLERYAVKGWQIMIAGDTVRYSLNGKPKFSIKSN